MWEALKREDLTPLDILVTDKEEACTRLAQLPCTDETEQERPRRIADRHVMIVTSKMSCAQKTRESCERLSPK
jgi:hypothetical protein